MTRTEVAYPGGAVRKRFDLATTGPIRVAAQSEAEFMAAVIDEATRTGWLTYHTHRSDKSGPGFPDCVFVRDRRLVIAEVKKVGGGPTMDQVRWLLALARVPAVEVYCWDAKDWDEIVRVLE